MEGRDELAAALYERGIGSNTIYSPPLHLQPVYAGLDYAVGSLPVTEQVGARNLGLPIGPHLELAEIDSVAAAVIAWLGERPGSTGGREGPR